MNRIEIIKKLADKIRWNAGIIIEFSDYYYIDQKSVENIISDFLKENNLTIEERKLYTRGGED